MTARIDSSGWGRAIGRGFAIFIGGFTLLNLLMTLRMKGMDGDIWWIEGYPLPGWLTHVLLALAAGGLLIGISKPAHQLCRRLGWGGLALLSALCLLDVLHFYRQIFHGTLHTRVPVPLGLIIGLVCCGAMPALFVPLDNARRFGWLTGVVLLACLVGYPVALIGCQGTIDEREPADIAVVFGAQAYADGTPSDSLADRVHTACILYRQGLAPLLIFSGGPGDGDITEPEVMRRQARSEGVPNRAIILDTRGWHTDATVRNTLPIFRQRHLHRVLTVSHFYHCPRIKLAYQHAGLSVRTVPARNSEDPEVLLVTSLREIPAFWTYYLR